LVVAPEDHYTNRVAVTLADFWDAILSIIKKYGGHMAALNFGKWESQDSNDKYKVDCHAHAHIAIRPNPWVEMVARTCTDAKEKRIQQSTQPPKNYVLIDCKELEDYRLTTLQSRVFLSSERSSKKDLQKLTGNVHDLTSKVEGLTCKVEGLTCKVEDLTCKVEDLTGKVSTFIDEQKTMNHTLVAILTKLTETKT
jgi:outer membrane murein-binding lipoprotein Lpp